MKKLAYFVMVFVATFLALNVVAIQAQTPVDQWGFLGGRIGGWQFMPGAAPGSASVGGNAQATSAWVALRGQFSSPITATTAQAIVVTGKIEFVGSGIDTWSGLRYGLFRHNSAGTLITSPVDSTRWSGSEADASGYMFTPVSGTNTPVDNNTQFIRVSGNWISSSSGSGPIRAAGLTEQKPRQAVATAGTYEFAFSVQPLANGTKEVRFYLIKGSAAQSTQATYYFGGSFIDTTTIVPTFNGVVFAAHTNEGSGSLPDLRQVKLTDVKAGLGAPITVPEAPWSAFYVSDWGSTPPRGTGWPILNRSTTVIGDASMGGTEPPKTWATIRGGFGTDLEVPTDKALIVSGQLEYVGGGVGGSYVGLRYALTYLQGATLNYKNTDSARWVYTSGFYGYELTPRAGTADIANGTNGVGTIWTLKNVAGWNSTYNVDIVPFATVEQAPRFADITEGVYDWAISVQRLADGSNEVRWYLVKKAAAGQPTTYWFGGTAIDTKAITTKFNGICFGIGDGITTGLKQFNLIGVKVDYGNPITVPAAPWAAFYVQNWGSTPPRGTGWPILNRSTTVIGDASMGGTEPPKTWATIRGGFGTDLEVPTDKALIVSGQLEYVGGGVGGSYVGLRYALTYLQGATLNYKNTDSARWVYTSGFYGYELTPRAGTADIANGTNGVGTIWTLKNVAGWNSTYNVDIVPFATVEQAPRFADITEGVYDWAISVQRLADGSNEVRWYLVKKAAAGQPTTYWFGGTAIDTKAITTKFNGICFGIGDGITTGLKQFNLIGVKVDLGAPITVPEAPWAAYYVGDWGFYGGKTGGWTLTKPLLGNATITGIDPIADLSSVRGGIGVRVGLKDGKALTVTGKLEFVGGGFEAWGSLRCGIFYSSNPGRLGTTGWSGTEGLNYGYLFLPPSGSNGPVDWTGTPGTWGGIIGGIWRNPGSDTAYVLGADLQSPANAVGSAGVYNFTISISPAGTGKNEVSFSLVKTDNSYSFKVKRIDTHSPLASTQFNCVAFAFNHGNTTTAINLTDVKVDLVDHIVKVEEPPAATIPTAYALSQNYPNPFNPSTVIGYDIPKNSHVSVRIYDVLGRLVATLVDGVQSPSSYRVQWNPAGLSSGVYFYRIQAQSLDGSGDFSAVKKLLLTK